MTEEQIKYFRLLIKDLDDTFEVSDEAIYACKCIIKRKKSQKWCGNHQNEGMELLLLIEDYYQEKYMEVKNALELLTAAELDQLSNNHEP